MRETTAVPATMSHHGLARLWRLVAVAIGLGVLAVLVPDDASSRWAAVLGLVVLASAVASVALVRRAGRHVRTASDTVADDVVLDDVVLDGAAVAVPVAGTVAAAVGGSIPADLPAEGEAALVGVAREHDRAELLAAGGDALHEFQAEAAWARQQRPAAPPSLDPADGGLPSQRGAGALASEAAGSPPAVTHWVPLDDDVMPSLRSGWPFSPHHG